MTTAECSHDKLRDRSEVDSRDVSPLVRLLSQQPYSSVSLEWDISQANLTPLTQRQLSSSSFLSSLTLNGSARSIHTRCCPSPEKHTLLTGRHLLPALTSIIICLNKNVHTELLFVRGHLKVARTGWFSLGKAAGSDSRNLWILSVHPRGEDTSFLLVVSFFSGH